MKNIKKIRVRKWQVDMHFTRFIIGVSLTSLNAAKNATGFAE